MINKISLKTDIGNSLKWVVRNTNKFDSQSNKHISKIRIILKNVLTKILA